MRRAIQWLCVSGGHAIHGLCRGISDLRKRSGGQREDRDTGGLG
jgi:hypothetical protein